MGRYTNLSLLLSAKCYTAEELIVCGADVSGGFVTRPEPVEVDVGDEAKMLCQVDDDTPVNWQLRLFSSFTERERICYNGEIVDDLKGKYDIERGSEGRSDIDTGSTGTYNLIIHDVNVSDAGEYSCHSRGGLGDKAAANLTIRREQGHHTGKNSVSLLFLSA